MAYTAIHAIRIDHIHYIEKPRRDTDCPRCGRALNGPRPGGMCKSCRNTLDFEEAMARHGIDLASLADDEFIVYKTVSMPDGERRKMPIIVKDEEVAA